MWPESISCVQQVVNKWFYYSRASFVSSFGYNICAPLTLLQSVKGPPNKRNQPMISLQSGPHALEANSRVPPYSRGLLLQRQVPGAVHSRGTRTAAAHTRLREGGGSAAAAQPAPAGGAVVSPLVGKKVLQLSPGLSAVPLLHPIHDNLPFAASLQIYSTDSAAAASSMTQQDLNHQHASTLVELHYVISGNGYFSNAASGVQQALWPGDSIISLHGAATFAAGPMPDGASQQQEQQKQDGEGPQGSSPAWSQLLGWLQQLHAKQQRQQHTDVAAQPIRSPQPAAASGQHTSSSSSGSGSDGDSSSQLVMLQLLLPSELLTGEMLHHTAAHCQAVAAQLPWGPASDLTHRQHVLGSNGSSSSSSVWVAEGAGSAAPLSSIHEAHVCGLLADAGLASSGPSQAAQSAGQQQQPRHTGGSNEAHSSNTSTSSGAAHVYTSLRQQQCLKRALCEVGAFRLPQQTNRLALLFGPHASPAVCCSFGVEVFEPGHVTPLHIHNTAHELFFVLAGRGEAVFRYDGIPGEGSGGTQPHRVAVGPGDVAVFAPGVVHGLDNPSGSQLAALQMMLPNEAFVEWVQSGQEAGVLDVSFLQRLAAAASCG